MTRKRRVILNYAFLTAICLFFIIIAFSSGTLWPNTIVALVFASAFAIPIYWNYHFRHSPKKEKERMISQKQFNSYYYNRWYIPADSTELDYQVERIKRRKNLGKH